MSQNTHNVRTRREQLATYPESVCVGRYSGDTWQLELDSDDLDADRLVEGPVLYVRCDIAHRSQTEAEARGAAEERRKDAEAQEPVYQYQYSDQSWCDTSQAEYERNTALDPNDTRILYTHPANVAALEARVKALEGVLQKADEFVTNGIEFGYIRMPDADTPDTALATPGIIRAALTREGGV